MFDIPNRSIKIRAWLPLLAILACGLTLRILFATGIVRNDEVNYAHAAFELASGRLHFDTWWQGTTRIGLYGPTAIMYALFGVHTWTTLFFSMASSLLGIFVIYLIGYLLDDEKTGLIAALLWAVFPLDVYQAGTFRPDAPMATFCAVSVFFLLLYLRPKTKRKNIALGLSILFLLVAISIKPLAIIVGFFYIFLLMWSLWERREAFYKRVGWLRQGKIRRAVFFALGTILSVGAFLYIRFQTNGLLVLLSQTATDASRLLLIGEGNISQARGMNTNLFLFFAPLAILGLYTLLFEQKGKRDFLLAWFGFSFLYYEWGTIKPSLYYFPILNFIEARVFEFVLVPAVLIAAIYVTSVLKKRTNETIFLSCFFAILAAIVLQNQISSGEVLGNWFYALCATAFLTMLLFPFLRKNKKYAEPSAVALIGLVCVASLLPTPPYHLSYWAPQRSFRTDWSELGTFLAGQPGIVYVPNVATGRDVNLGSNFELGYAWGREPVETDRIRVGAPSASEDGAFVIRLSPQSNPNWALIEEYENDFQDIYLYEVAN